MGFFSWQCAECNESVMNKWSHQPEKSDCVLVTPDKNYHDPAYDGYGVFDGADVYEMLGNGDRTKGIYAEPKDRPFKIKLLHSRCHSPSKSYDDYSESASCPDQGFFGDDREMDEYGDPL